MRCKKILIAFFSALMVVSLLAIPKFISRNASAAGNTVKMVDMQTTEFLACYNADSFTDSYGNTYNDNIVCFSSPSDSSIWADSSVNGMSDATYELNGAYSKFTATIVCADSTPKESTLTLGIWADGKNVYQDTGITKSDAPKKIDIDVTGVGILEIRVQNNHRGYGDLLFVNGLFTTSNRTTFEKFKRLNKNDDFYLIDSSDYYKNWLNHSLTDNMGDLHHSAVGFSYYGWGGAPTEYYALYNLKGEVASFEAVAFVTDSSDSYNFAIYLDDKLVKEYKEINKTTKPVNIKIDTTGAQTMKLSVTRADGKWCDATVAFADTILKTANPKATATNTPSPTPTLKPMPKVTTSWNTSNKTNEGAPFYELTSSISLTAKSSNSFTAYYEVYYRELSADEEEKPYELLYTSSVYKDVKEIKCVYGSKQGATLNSNGNLVTGQYLIELHLPDYLTDKYDCWYYDEYYGDKFCFSEICCSTCVVSAVETTGIGGFVDRLYTVALGRDSDPNGKADWINRVRTKGYTGADVARGFLFSPEFINKKMTNSEFLDVLYRVFFDRESDYYGKQDWLKRMNKGWSKQDVINGFIDSVEWANVCLRFGIPSGGAAKPTTTVTASADVKAFVERLYSTCLNRKPDTKGLNDWAYQLANMKVSGSVAAHGFFFSEEFIKANYSDSEYVTRLYRAFMGREPDSAGFDGWMKILSNGGSREEVFKGFAGSTEWATICSSYGILK